MTKAIPLFGWRPVNQNFAVSINIQASLTSTIWGIKLPHKKSWHGT